MVIGLSDEQDDKHLQNLAEEPDTEGNRPRNELAFVVFLKKTGQEPFGDGGNGTGKGRKTTQRIAVQAGHDTDGRAEVRAANETGRHDADHARVGEGVLNGNPAVGAENGDAGKNHSKGDAVEPR